MGVVAGAVLLAVAVNVAVAGQTPVEARRVVCFGSEPSWSVGFDQPWQARVTLPDAPPAEYRGRETRNEPLGESVWRGTGQGTRGDLVVWLRDAACSDGMSDTTHPVIARVSLPDGGLLAGCCRVQDATAGSAPLEGPTWRLVGLPGQPASTLSALARAASLRLDAGRVTGFTGCNSIAGTYRLAGNAVTFGRLAGTMIACPEPASSVERAFTQALQGALTHTATSNRMSLTTTSGVVLEFEREPVSALEGPVWAIAGYDNGRQAAVTPIAGTTVTLTFANGTVTGQAGCNTFRAGYSTDGDHVTIGVAAATRKMCADAVMAQERDVLRALASATRWTVEAGQLDMRRADGQHALTARRADPK